MTEIEVLAKIANELRGINTILYISFGVVILLISLIFMAGRRP